MGFLQYVFFGVEPNAIQLWIFSHRHREDGRQRLSRNFGLVLWLSSKDRLLQPLRRHICFSCRFLCSSAPFGAPFLLSSRPRLSLTATEVVRSDSSGLSLYLYASLRSQPNDQLLQQWIHSAGCRASCQLTPRSRFAQPPAPSRTRRSGSARTPTWDQIRPWLPDARWDWSFRLPKCWLLLNFLQRFQFTR